MKVTTIIILILSLVLISACTQTINEVEKIQKPLDFTISEPILINNHIETVNQCLNTSNNTNPCQIETCINGILNTTNLTQDLTEIMYACPESYCDGDNLITYEEFTYATCNEGQYIEPKCTIANIEHNSECSFKNSVNKGSNRFVSSGGSSSKNSATTTISSTTSLESTTTQETTTTTITEDSKLDIVTTTIEPTTTTQTTTTTEEITTTTNDDRNPEVPEFSTIGALLVLILTGTFINKKRK